MKTAMHNGIANLVDRASRSVGQRVDASLLEEVQAQIDQMNDTRDALLVFTSAWRFAGLPGKPLRLQNPTPADLPFVAQTANGLWALMDSRASNGVWQGADAQGNSLALDAVDATTCLSIPRRSNAPGRSHTALRLVLKALWRRKGVFIDATIATSLINFLTLATSLYSMQVYDRVIPSQGFHTLWVLTVGVALSISLEFLLKQVRSHAVDKTCTAIDSELSGWFFDRMLGIRMEARPASVGTLASQVKGFEMVRGMLASTSLFVLADVPFTVLFLLVIASIGGWIVVVPLVALPIALFMGLLFQRAVQRQTRLTLAGTNRKVGLLVEAVDGAESLKASSAEWRLKGRWGKLVDETNEAEHRTKSLSTLSQNIAMAIQQLSYVALVATGAWMVAENQLTMGGLLACSIIGSRAMTPIVQLPGVMLQWALAKAAMEGLDQIIKLPNEADDAHHALAPQFLDGGFRFERVRFAYGSAKHLALEVEQLTIRPGEKIGLVGPIGSGKSTLLKIASGLYRPSDGKVYLGGIDMALLATPVVRETVGYLNQDARLVSGSLRDNLLLGLTDPGEEAILTAAKRTGLIELIVNQPKGLALEITEGGRGVSGGQKQLIALTRMLLANPKVWVLDEPNDSMDSGTEARMIGLLKELTDKGATLLVATHKTAMLPLLDRLIVMQGGRIILDGPRDAVLAKLAGKPQAIAQGASA